MPVSKEDVKKIAILARLKLTNIEIEQFTVQFSDIMEYFQKLQEIELDEHD